MAHRYDLLIAGGRVIDPAAGLDDIRDIAIKDTRIAAVEPAIDPAEARRVEAVAGRLVLPGLIDTHAHVFEHAVGRFGLNPDLVGVRSGVTTLVDLGGASYMSMDAFRHYVVEPARTRVHAFVSIYPVGEGHLSADLYGPGIDVDACVRCIEANRDLVKGIKVNAEIGTFARHGFGILDKAKEASRAAGVPLYVHFGQLFRTPEKANVAIDLDSLFPDAVARLDPGDIMAHPFSRHPGGFIGADGRVHPIVTQALARGLRIDVGHGSHFSFAMARKVLDAGIVPTTLGGDLHGYNTDVTPTRGVPEVHPDPEMMPFAGGVGFSLCHAMTELVALGLALEDVVPMVTSHAAEGLGLAGEAGTLEPGVMADLSVLADERGRWSLRDNDGTELSAERLVRPLFCLRAGVRIDADAPVLPEQRAA